MLKFLLFIFLAAICNATLPTGDTVTNSIGIKFKRIPAGNFMMGYEGGTLPTALQYEFSGKDYFSTGIYNEKPQHKVSITSDFYMAVFETKIGEFKKFKPSVMERYGEWDPKGDYTPVYGETWFEADSFCKWLTANDPNGWKYRLPTEAEWEYACRAGTTTRFYNGDVVTADLGNLMGPVYGDGIKSVGSYPPNPWGLYDMLGNVKEWCNDWYGDFTPEDQTNPGGYDLGTYKVQKGLVSVNPTMYRSAARAGDHPFNIYDEYNNLRVTGFRVVISETTPTVKAMPDTMAPWQKLFSSGRPTPTTTVAGSSFTDGDGRLFIRLPLKSVALHAPYISQRDSVVFVCATPIASPNNIDKKSAGLFAQSLSLKFGVLYRISNRYELAFAGVSATKGEYYLTIVPDLAYKSGKPHPDVAYYQERRMQKADWSWDGTADPRLWGMFLGGGVTELPNGDLSAGFQNSASEELQGPANGVVAIMKNDTNAWSPYFVTDERPNCWDGGKGLSGDHWTGKFSMINWESVDFGKHWSVVQPKSAPCGAFPYNGDTLVGVDWGGFGYHSLDSGNTWNKSTNTQHGIETSPLQLDDGRILTIPRSNGEGWTPDSTLSAIGQFITNPITGTVEAAAGPFPPCGCCGRYPKLIKLHSGRLLVALPSNTNGWTLGESVDSGNHWFVRRMIPDLGYGDFCQERSGIIHIIGDDRRFSGGDNIHLSFSEEWLCEGTPVPFAQWAVANYYNRIDTTVMELSYLPPLATGPEKNESTQKRPTVFKLTASPNPFNPSTAISYALTENKGLLTITNIQGKMVQSFPLSRPSGTLLWNGKSFPAGCYVVRLVSGKQSRSVKTILQK